MTIKRLLLSGVVVAALSMLVGAALYHAQSTGAAQVAQGQGRGQGQNYPRHPVTPAPVITRQRRGRVTVAHARLPAIVVAHLHPVRLAARPVHLAPFTPRSIGVVGGEEPPHRLLAPGAWLNATSFDVVMRVSSPMPTARLQPRIEVRPLGQAFTGRPTMSGATAVLAYRGTSSRVIIHVTGLHDGSAYHWRVRVWDSAGLGSTWTSPGGTAGTLLRVHLARPAAPLPALLTPAYPGAWVATRLLALHWSVPPDSSGIRGYSYTLSRNPAARPQLRWRTGLTSVSVPARGDGAWYFTVRALDNAHTWGPAARLLVHIDTHVPRLTLLSVPHGVVNPAHMNSLLRLQLRDWSRIRVEVVAPGGRVIRALRTSLHGPGYRAVIRWDGLDMRGRVAPSGRYMLIIGAANRSGRTWRMMRPVTIESTPPVLTASGFTQTGSYNPYNNAIDGPEVVTATLSEPASVRVDMLNGGRVVRRWALVAARAGQVLSVTWDGTGRGSAALPEGQYAFRLTAMDAAGNRAAMGLGAVWLDLRRIVVSLNAQQMWALDGNRVLLTSIVTTGGPELPTPTGDFQIIDRESPFTFRSPYPKGSRFWYRPSPTNFALLFQVNGYFIHDAPWRSYYGPGSNAVDGIPGTNITGTHGCVNVPYYSMAWLFNWATMYTPVQVRQQFSI